MFIKIYESQFEFTKNSFGFCFCIDLQKLKNEKETKQEKKWPSQMKDMRSISRKNPAST